MELEVNLSLPACQIARGTYTVRQGEVRVVYEGRSKASRIGGIPINWHAKMLLRELVTEEA